MLWKNFDDTKKTSTDTTRWFDRVTVLTAEFRRWMLCAKDARTTGDVRDVIDIYPIVRVRLPTTMYAPRVNAEIRTTWVAIVWNV